MGWISKPLPFRGNILTHGPCFLLTLHLTATFCSPRCFTRTPKVTVTPVKGQLLNRAVLWSLTSSFSVVQSQRLLHSWHHLKTRQTKRAGWRCVGNSTGRSWPPTPASYLETVSLKDKGNKPDIYQQQPENEQAKKWPTNKQGMLLPSSGWAVLHIIHESNATRKIAGSTRWKPLERCSITPGTWLRLAVIILSLNSVQFCIRKKWNQGFCCWTNVIVNYWGMAGTQK